MLSPKSQTNERETGPVYLTGWYLGMKDVLVGGRWLSTFRFPVILYIRTSLESLTQGSGSQVNNIHTHIHLHTVMNIQRHTYKHIHT